MGADLIRRDDVGSKKVRGTKAIEQSFLKTVHVEKLNATARVRGVGSSVKMIEKRGDESMSYLATVHLVLIASPSDITEEEKKAIADTIHGWNAENSRSSEAVLLPVRWETHSTPGMGMRPQEMINKQLVEISDILVGIFWTRFGTNTGVSESGTLEEIEEFRKANKPTLLYFSSIPVPPSDVDTAQLNELRAFRDRIIAERWGLIESFSSTSELQTKLDRHLTSVVMNLKSLTRANAPQSPEVVLKESEVPQIKNQLLRVLSTYEADWTAERNSRQLSCNGGKRILRRFGEELLQFRSQLFRLVDDGTIAKLDKLLEMTKGIQKHEIEIDGGSSYKDFWKKGDEIFRQSKFAIDQIQEKT